MLQSQSFFTISFPKIKAKEVLIRIVFCVMKVRKEKFKEPKAKVISLDFYLASFPKCLKNPLVALTV